MSTVSPLRVAARHREGLYSGGMDKVKSAPTARLVDEATALLGDYLSSGRTRTDLLRALAAKIFDLRAACQTADGSPDWGGRSAAYRDAVHEVYFRARVPEGDADTVQAAIRYHLGNLLREKVPPEELAAAGFPPESPREQKDRARRAVKALATSGSVAEVLGDPLRLLTAAQTLLDHVSDADLRGLQRGERAAARRALNVLVERGGSLRAVLGTR